MAVNYGLISGLAQNAATAGERAARWQERRDMDKEDERAMKVSQKLSERMRDPNFDMVANNDFQWLMANRPEQARSQMAAFNSLDKKRKNEYIQDMTKVRDQLLMGNYEGAVNDVGERIAKITERGGDPSDSIRLFQTLQTNPQYALQGLENMTQAAASYDFGRSSDKPANLQTFDQMVKTAGLTKKEAQQAARINLGLEPRASTSAIERIADDPDKTNAVAEAEAIIAGRKKAAELIKRMELEPQLEADIKSSVARAKNMADRAEKQKSDQASWEVYQTGMGGLVRSLGDAETGTISGLIPAVTTESKVAEGAISIMRPIIKDAVRSAGEGTFTDKDQELIDSMIPTRTDDPSARAAKIEMLDNFMRAKLRIGKDQPLFGGQSNSQSQNTPQQQPQQQMSDDEEVDIFDWPNRG